jgi:hypothetical protein
MSSSVSDELYDLIKKSEKKINNGKQNNGSIGSNSINSKHFIEELVKNTESASASLSYCNTITDSDSQYSSIISVVSDVKCDMHKLIRIINILDNKANEYKNKTDSLEKDITLLKEELEKLSRETKSSFDIDSHKSSKLDSKSKFFSSADEDSISASSISSSSSKLLYSSKTGTNSCNSFYGSIDGSSIMSSIDSCSRHEFLKFKNDVTETINKLASKVDSQIRTFSVSMSPVIKRR